MQRIEIAEITVVRHKLHTRQRHADGVFVVVIGSHCGGALSHAVETIGERHNGLTAGIFARNLQCRFHRIGTGRAGKLHFVLHFTRLEDALVEALQERCFSLGMHVQAMGDAVRLDVFQQGFLKHRVVVPVVQRAGATEEVDVFIAFVVSEDGVLCLGESHRKRAAVATHVGFEFVIDIHGVFYSCAKSMKGPI